MNLTFSVIEYVVIIFIVASCCFIIGIMAAYDYNKYDDKWKYCHEKLPEDRGRIIINYPVAFFDDEFGIVVDQAEYHPNRADKWLTVMDGIPCSPFAWYDLPYPPYPPLSQHVGPRGGVDTYA